MSAEVKRVEVIHLVCPRCSLEWTAMFVKPKVCPRCKLYLKWPDEAALMSSTNDGKERKGR